MITTQLTEKFGLAKVKEMLKDIVDGCYDSALEKQKADGYIVLERGLATTPLAGLDVPLHFSLPSVRCHVLPPRM
jgi:hypothetical protein